MSDKTLIERLRAEAGELEKIDRAGSPFMEHGIMATVRIERIDQLEQAIATIERLQSELAEAKKLAPASHKALYDAYHLATVRAEKAESELARTQTLHTALMTEADRRVEQAESLVASLRARVEAGEKATEIRLNTDGSLDEVCAPRFHLEQMSATHWWMGIGPDDGLVHVNLHSKATIRATVEDERSVNLAPTDS